MPDWIDGIKVAFRWLNLWSRLSKCEQDRARKGDQIQFLQTAMRDLTEELASIRSLGHIGSVVVNFLGRITSVTAEFGQMSGYSVKELVGMRLLDLLPFRYQADFTAAFKQVVERTRPLRAWPLEGEMRRKDGSEEQVLVSLSEVYTGSGPHFRADVRRR